MERAKKEWDEEFMHYLPYIKDDDFLGVQNYTRSLIGADGQLPNPDGAELTQMNYEFYPEALEHVLRKVAKDFHGDLYVTEKRHCNRRRYKTCRFYRHCIKRNCFLH